MTIKRLPVMQLATALALCAMAGVDASQAQANGTRINPHVQMPTNYVNGSATSATPAKPVLPSNALPVNGQVSAGQATISQSGNAMTVQQTTARAVINWDSYNDGLSPIRYGMQFNQKLASV